MSGRCKTGPRWAPAWVIRWGSMGPMASRTRPGAEGPWWTSSSPVISTATVGWGMTVRRLRPSEAASPRTGPSTTTPAGRTTSPARHSSPARLMCRPASPGPLTQSPSSSTSSSRTTLVVPAGTAAPVVMLHACPTVSSTEAAQFTLTCPITRHGPAPLTAYPSIADRSTGGTAPGDTNGLASTHPAASASTRDTAACGRPIRCATRRAESHDTCSGRGRSFG